MGRYKIIYWTIWLAIAASVLILTAGSARSQVVMDSVAQLQKIDVEEHLGDTIPMDLMFTDDEGNSVRIGDYFGQDKPVLMVLAYYECPMLCNLILNGIVQGIKDLDWRPGEDYQIVTVSINPRETYELAAAKKKNYLSSLQISSASKGWSFLTGEESQSKALADAFGFKYYWDEKKQQYAHPAVIYLLSEDGKITRYLYGIDYKRQDLKLALLEASEGKIGSTLDKLILYCYHYDPDSEGYVVFAGNVMRLGGVLTLVLLAMFLGGLWYREHHKKTRGRSADKPLNQAR
ncbi:MAG: SCO family protein [Candidatus Zixiibacteriota bacterium]